MAKIKIRKQSSGQWSVVWSKDYWRHQYILSNEADVPERVQKILSAHGAASRREAERLIREGRVTINGIKAEIGQSAVYGNDEISVDGAPLVQRGKPVYIMLNKPRGYVTTCSDESGRKTVLSLVEDAGARVYPVGRLDITSEGLLLLTNDGDFANAVAHPSHGKIKSYEVLVRGNVDCAEKKLSCPIAVDEHIVKADSVKLLNRTKDGGSLCISVGEGRNRQIRKMCACCGLEVLSLKRISIGPLKLGSLKKGQWRHLTDEEYRSISGRE